MCQACEGDEQQAGISPALAGHARRIEAAMAGPKVADEAWDILLGRRGGAVPWVETQRMLTCLDLAAQKISGRLRCDPA
ncbi:MAG: hypothetical protein QOF90_1986 [Acetobacteraceae bacterium]|jgi:hypothetical protein|nr:hypothetical protein [Acetobacteraceae bacterium]MEA2790671.1 hypothetical protein [Acetobacteraceae bacterium]